MNRNDVLPIKMIRHSCYNKMRKPAIKVGDKYNRLTAIGFHHRNKHGSQYWLFKCDCGNKKVINVNCVKRGEIKSCGCLQRERNTTHGLSNTKEHIAWTNMKQRCHNKNNKNYKNWGGRKIKVCDRWQNSFENFYKDMGKRPTGTSLDRIDGNGNYEPNNCRWATIKEQNNNTRRNHPLTFNGKTQNISQWANEIGIDYYILYSRIWRGWSVERALTT